MCLIEYLPLCASTINSFIADAAEVAQSRLALLQALMETHLSWPLAADHLAYRSATFQVLRDAFLLLFLPASLERAEDYHECTACKTFHPGGWVGMCKARQICLCKSKRAACLLERRNARPVSPHGSVVGDGRVDAECYGGCYEFERRVGESRWQAMWVVEILGVGAGLREQHGSTDDVEV